MFLQLYYRTREKLQCLSAVVKINDDDKKSGSKLDKITVEIS